MLLFLKDNNRKVLKVTLILLLFSTTLISNIWPMDFVKAARVNNIDVDAPSEAFNNGRVRINYVITIESASDTSVSAVLEEEASGAELTRTWIFPVYVTDEDPINIIESSFDIHLPLYLPEDLPLTITLNLIVMEGSTELASEPIPILIVGELEEYHAHILSMEVTDPVIYAGNLFNLLLTVDLALPEGTEIWVWVDEDIEGVPPPPFGIVDPDLIFELREATSGVYTIPEGDEIYMEPRRAPVSDTPYTLIINVELSYRLPEGELQTDEEGTMEIRKDVQIADFNWAVILEVHTVPSAIAGGNIPVAVEIEYHIEEAFAGPEIKLKYVSDIVAYDQEDVYERDVTVIDSESLHPSIDIPAMDREATQSIDIYLYVWNGTEGDWDWETYRNCRVTVGLRDLTNPERVAVRILDVTVHDPVRVRSSFDITIEYEYYVELETECLKEIVSPIGWGHTSRFMLDAVDPAEAEDRTASRVYTIWGSFVPLVSGPYDYSLSLARFDMDEGWIIDEGGETTFHVDVISEIGDEGGERGTALNIVNVTKIPELITPPFRMPTDFLFRLIIWVDFDNIEGGAQYIRTFIYHEEAGVINGDGVTRSVSDYIPFYFNIHAPSTEGDWSLRAYAVIYEDDGETFRYWDSLDFTVEVVDAGEEGVIDDFGHVDWAINRLLWGIDGSELVFDAELSIVDTDLEYPLEGDVTFSIDGIPLGDHVMASIGEGEPFTRATSPTWTPALGPHTLRAEVAAVPPELDPNPDDNVLELAFTVGGGMPDMPPAPPYDVPPEPVDGEDFNFNISIDPSTQTIGSGEDTAFPVEVSLLSGESAPVSLRLRGLPSGASYTFDDPTGMPGFDTSLRVAVRDSVVSGIYMLSVEGEGGSVTQSAIATLIVEGSPNRSDFSLSVMPETVGIDQGEDGSVRISVSSERGYDHMVSLDVVGLPNGASGSFSQSAGMPDYVPTLTLTVGENVPLGEYRLTVTASGSGMRRESVRLIVEEGEAAALEGMNIAQYTTPILGVLILAVAGASIAWLVRRRKVGKPKKPKIPRKIAGYCIECGAPLHADDEFCPKCGEAQKGKS